MSDQISHDAPIWGLTPTELLIAYWSLTLKKPEIADKAHISEGTVGTHLTSIYTKLGLSELDDEVKRSLLATRHGEALNSIVKEIDAEFVEYADKTKALQKKKSEVLKGKKEAESPLAEPGMQSPPPPPQSQPQIQRQTGPGGLPRPVWIIGGLVLFFVLCGFFGINFFRGLFDQTVTNTPQVNTQVVINDTATSFSATQTPTQTTEPSPSATLTTPTPTEAPSATVLPTALPLPIREDFSHQYSDLWWVSGEPLVTESIFNGLYSGVLTTQQDQTATLLIGNTAWTNYVVSFAARIWNQTSQGTHLFIGLRVIDLNNMIGLDCESAYLCTWVVIYQGEWDKLPTSDVFYTEEPVTITVDGDTFTAKGFDQHAYQPETTSFVLPPRYKGKFTGGGVMIQLTSIIEIDYVEIDPLP